MKSSCEEHTLLGRFLGGRSYAYASLSRAALRADSQRPVALLAARRSNVTMATLKERTFEIILILAVLLCGGLLVATLGMVLVHIICGLFIMGVATYTLLCGQEASSRTSRLGWFLCTGVVFFLFGYWALQVVFRPPQLKEGIGCGGVRFITSENAQAEDGRGGSLRTEL